MSRGEGPHISCCASYSSNSRLIQRRLEFHLPGTYFESLPIEILQTVSQYVSFNFTISALSYKQTYHKQASLPRCAEMYANIVIAGTILP